MYLFGSSLPNYRCWSALTYVAYYESLNLMKSYQIWWNHIISGFPGYKLRNIKRVTHVENEHSDDEIKVLSDDSGSNFSDEVSEKLAQKQKLEFYF